MATVLDDGLSPGLFPGCWAGEPCIGTGSRRLGSLEGIVVMTCFTSVTLPPASLHATVLCSTSTLSAKAPTIGSSKVFSELARGGGHLVIWSFLANFERFAGPASWAYDLCIQGPTLRRTSCLAYSSALKNLNFLVWTGRVERTHFKLGSPMFESRLYHLAVWSGSLISEF